MYLLLSHLNSSIFFSLSQLFLFQENMKKRLHYAMPRVPLNKLKGDNEHQDSDEEPISHVGTMARRIVEAKSVHQQLENIADDSSQGKQHGMLGKSKTFLKHKTKKKKHVDFAEAKHSMQFQTKESIGRGKSHMKMTTNQVENILSLDLSRRDMKQLQKIESKLQRKHKGKKLQFVLVECESSDEITQKQNSDGSSDSDTQLDGTTRVKKYLHEMPAINTSSANTSEEVNVIVSADVHQDMDSMEGAVGGIVEPPPVEKSWEKIWHLRADDEAKQQKGNIPVFASDSSEELHSCNTARTGKGWYTTRREDQTVEMKILNKHNSGGKGKTQVKWGQEEKSESDSDGWWQSDDDDLSLL